MVDNTDMDFIEKIVINKMNSNFENTFFSNNKIIIYCAGAVAQVLLEDIPKIDNIYAVCDKEADNYSLYCNKYRFATIEKILEEYDMQKLDLKIAISSLKYYSEVKKELLKYVSEDMILGYVNWETRIHYNFRTSVYKQWLIENKSQLNSIYSKLTDSVSKKLFEYALIGKENVAEEEWKENVINSEFGLANYFDNNIYDTSDNEVFLDVGAYDGDTLKAFVKYTQNKYKKIIAYEPDEELFKELHDEVKKMQDDRIEINKKGLSSFNGVMGFETSNNKFLSQPSDEAVNKIEVVTIDEIKDEITLIKICIKGTNNIMNVMEGGKNTLCKKAPKLAILVSPNEDDIIKIPEKLMQINPNYKLFFRIASYSQQNDQRLSYCYYASI